MLQSNLNWNAQQNGSRILGSAVTKQNIKDRKKNQIHYFNLEIVELLGEKEEKEREREREQ